LFAGESSLATNGSSADRTSVERGARWREA
jgi:hypothetical protein